MKGEKHRDWGLCSEFGPGASRQGFPVFLAAVPSLMLISHLTALLRTAGQASAQAEKGWNIFKRMDGTATEGHLMTKWKGRKRGKKGER